MTPLRPSVDYQPLAPLRLDGPRPCRLDGLPSSQPFLRGLLVAVALALPALGARITDVPQHRPMPGAAQIAATPKPSPLRVAAVRLP